MNEIMLTGAIQAAQPVSGDIVDDQGLTGTVSTESGVSGTMTAEAQLTGRVSGEVQLSGDVSPTGVLQGIVALAKTIGVSPEVIAKAIADYFEKNPVTVITKYPDLEQKPKINGVELDGDKSASDLQLQPAGKYLTEIPSEYVTEDELSAKGYAVKTEVPSVPGWAMQEAKPPYTAAEVGADQSGTADGKVSEHNVNTAAHNDIRVLLLELTNRLNALADSDDTTLDQMSEIVAYIKSNKSLIESVTTEKVSYTDIIDNLVTNLPGKPLSAAQGVALKALIDAIKVPTKVSELDNDEGYLKEHQSLAAYALKTEIPTVPKNVSAFSNDAGYLTQHQDISGKLDADKLPQAIDAALNGNFADYVIEAGVANGWKWEKWNSGKYICWGTFRDTRTHYTMVNGFYGYYSSDFKYPITFPEAPIIHFNCKVGSGFAAPAGDVAMSTVQARCYALSTASGEVACAWEMYVVGRWK